MSGFQVSPPQLPPANLLGELTSSFIVFGALAVADFHRRRTGEGQAACVSLAHCATWGAVLVMPYLCDPGTPGLVGSSGWEIFRGLTSTDKAEGMDWLHQSPTLYGSYPTKDGAWVMLTCASAPRVIHALKKFGLVGRGVPKLLGHVLKVHSKPLTSSSGSVSFCPPLGARRLMRVVSAAACV
jgi:crotonobetainyl-CoA:carnitine CoA-transferase CaiB-like acyl-CoA transferase